MNSYSNIKEVLGIKKKIVWLYNIGVENVWHNTVTIKDNNSVKIVNEMEDMNLLLASTDDIVIMRNTPSNEYLSYMKEMGFNIPTIFELNYNDESKNISELLLEDDILLSKLKNLSDDYVLFPYGISELEEKISEITGLKLIGGSSKLSKIINNKIFAREVSESLGFKTTEGKKCTFEQIEEETNNLFVKYKKVIIKTPYGASGKGLYLVENKENIKRILLILKRFYTNEDFFLVEGWVENKKDFNYQLYVDDMEIKLFSIKKQIIDKTIYTGSLFQVDKKIESEILSKGMIVGKYLRKKYNYNGFLGVDCLTDSNELIPIIEINGRLTLSTYLSFIPSMFKNKCYFSFYKNVIDLTFSEVINKLKLANLQYSAILGKGAICYVEGTLQKNGRLFMLVIADNDNEIKDIYNKIIKTFNLGE